MRKATFGAVLFGSLFLAVPAAMAQTNLAYATASRVDYVVFFDGGSGHLSAAADDTIRLAAHGARSAGTVRLAGRADYAAAVKNELVRQGVPAGSIVIARETNRPLPNAADGIRDPANRRVEITF